MATEVEDEKAFYEAQMKFVDYQRQLNSVKSQMQAKDHERRSSILTNREISQLPDDTVMYRGIGKMFVKQGKQQIVSLLNERITKSREEVVNMEKTLAYLERNVKECEANITEMIQKKK